MGKLVRSAGRVLGSAVLVLAGTGFLVLFDVGGAAVLAGLGVLGPARRNRPRPGPGLG